MKEKTKFLFLAFLGIILSLFLLYALLSQTILPKGGPKERPPELPKPSPARQKTEVKLTLSPKEATIYPGQTLEIQVLAQTLGKLIATDMELSFAPQIFQVLEVKPGPFWPKPQPLTKVIDSTKGEILYGIATLEPKEGGGVIASLKLKVKKIPTLPFSTQITFGEGTQASVVGEETKLTLSPPSKYVILKER